MKAPQTKRSRGGAWALAWAALLVFGAETPCLLAMNNDMTDDQYARTWYSTGKEEKDAIVALRTNFEEAKKANPDDFPEGASAFDVYTQQIAAGTSAINRDIPWAIQVVAYLIDKKDADDSTETNDQGQVVAKNDLYRKIQNQNTRLDSDPKDSLVQRVRRIKGTTTGNQYSKTPLTTLFLAENDKLGAPPNSSDARFFKRLEYIQGRPGSSAPYLIRGGLIGSDSGDIDAQWICVAKVHKIIDRINAKTGAESSEHETLAKALSALDNKTDCSVFAKQIDARTPLKTIPKAVESVVGHFNSAIPTNTYGLIGLLTTDGYPVSTTDIYQRLNNALTLLDAALDTKFGNDYTKSDTTPTLQAIIAKLAAI